MRRAPIALNGQVISTAAGHKRDRRQDLVLQPRRHRRRRDRAVRRRRPAADHASTVQLSHQRQRILGNLHRRRRPRHRRSRSAGAQINALEQNSYVALVAPRIEQGGTVQVNGSAAYVAADQLTHDHEPGAVRHPGRCRRRHRRRERHRPHRHHDRRRHSAAGDDHGIYMVAVPKNQALTMLLGGDVGFEFDGRRL